MKNLLTTLAAACVLLLASCNSKDVTKVKVGMTTAEVESTIGKADQVIPLPFGIAWWKYGENQMLTISHDTVAAVIPDAKKFAEEMQKNLNEGLKAAEAAQEKLNNMDLAADDSSVVDNVAAEAEGK
jgi:hypothetical protein